MRDAPKWRRLFMANAKLISTMSKDPSTKVGVVLAKDGHIVGMGYNGFPRGVADDYRLHDRAEKYELIVHAELNAILDAGKESKGSTLYLYGFSSAPCRSCVKHVIQAGIQHVVACGPELPERWVEETRRSEETLLEAGIALQIMKESEL
jgi:dCMP deaminase